MKYADCILLLCTTCIAPALRYLAANTGHCYIFFDFRFLHEMHYITALLVNTRHCCCTAGVLNQGQAPSPQHANGPPQASGTTVFFILSHWACMSKVPTPMCRPPCADPHVKTPMWRPPCGRPTSDPHVHTPTYRSPCAGPHVRIPMLPMFKPPRDPHVQTPVLLTA